MGDFVLRKVTQNTGQQEIGLWLVGRRKDM